MHCLLDHWRGRRGKRVEDGVINVLGFHGGGGGAFVEVDDTGDAAGGVLEGCDTA